MNKSELTAAVIARAKAFDADLIAIGGAERFRDTCAGQILPGLRSVICIAFRVLRGSRRGIEEGTTFYQYSTTGIETIEEVLMPQTLLRVSALLEDEGYLAAPQKRNQTVHPDQNGTNPEMLHGDIYRGNTVEKALPFEESAVLCGLGELGKNGSVLTKEFGPFQRYAFILTTAELEETPLVQPTLCDGCDSCIHACPGHALDGEGKRNDWQCAVYYKGANRTKNPFMPENAYAEFPNRQQIMDGTAVFTGAEDAAPVLDNSLFYPPIKHSYVASVCGRACDTACYIHLEQQGKLTKQFKRNFRIRPEWRLTEDIEKTPDLM